MHDDLHHSLSCKDLPKVAANRETELERPFDSLERQEQKLLGKALGNGALAETFANRERPFADLARTVAVLRQELKQARARVEELVAEAAMASKLRERVGLLENSTSWRVMAPFRAAKESLLRMKSRITRKLQIGSTSRLPSGDIVGGIGHGPGDALWKTIAGENERHPASHSIAHDRILILDHRVPTPDRTSSSQRLWEMVKAICDLGFSVTFGSHYAPADYCLLLNNVEVELRSYVQALHGLGARTILGHADIVAHLKRFGSDYQQVILSYPEIMYQYLPVVRAYAPQAHVIYDTVDLHGLRLEREALVKGGSELKERARHYQKLENVNLRSADTVVTITESERDVILKLVPDAEVVVVPNIHVISEKPYVPPGEREGLLFIGHYPHNPNVDAVKYFVRDILPLVKQRIPGAKFFMIGSSMTEEVRDLANENVEAIGYVADPAPYFRRCRVFVAPLRFGAGMKGKIGQSISFGLPVVTTSIGAEGMGLVNEESVLIGDSPVEFAEAVVRLYTDDELWSKIAHEGRDIIQRNYSPHAVEKQIAALLTSGRERRSIVA
jgi:glycosyltransferase involved in cell wall biosynthesis